MLVKKDRVVIAPDEGAVILGGGVGFVGKLYGEENGGAFAIGEHPLEPGILAAPPHTHTNEDEISYVLEGEIGVMVGEEVYRAPAGSYVLKPPGVIHTFWNPGPESARVVEIFSPAGFERYFEGWRRSSPPPARRTYPASKRWPAGTAWRSIGNGWKRSCNDTTSDYSSRARTDATTTIRRFPSSSEQIQLERCVREC